jgi:DNA-binding transcriptional MerR regulator
VRGMTASVSIGEFSRLTHLTVKTLRHYHELGLLVPAQVDRHTGYRRYGTGQVHDALLIGRLRGLDLPLAEVGRLLAAPDPAERDAVLAEHLRRMERELDRTRAVVASLRELLAPTPASAVEYRTLPELTAVTLGGRVRREEIEAWCAAAFRRLHVALGATRPAGPAGATYADEFFT